MITSPTKRFQAKKTNVPDLRKIVDAAVFQEAVDMAIIKMNQDASYTTNPDPHRFFYRIEGANIFLKTLLELAEHGKLKQPETQPANLNWNT